MKIRYIYIINGKMMAGDEKPQEQNFVDCKFGGSVWNTGKYWDALEDWEELLVAVENVEKTKGGAYLLVINEKWQSFTSGQKAETVDTENGCKITKLL